MKPEADVHYTTATKPFHVIFHTLPSIHWLNVKTPRMALGTMYQRWHQAGSLNDCMEEGAASPTAQWTEVSDQ